MYASLEDIQGYIPEDKLEVTSVDTLLQQTEAYRLIRAMLFGTFAPAVMTSWLTPDVTPEIIRDVAGELTAAYLYRNAYAEDNSGDIPGYAQSLYDEAVAKIAAIIAGTLAVIGVDGGEITNEMQESETSFWPNNTTAGPYFSMDQIL